MPIPESLNNAAQTGIKNNIDQSLTRLINFETLKLPVRLIKGARVVGHKVRARPGTVGLLIVEADLPSQLPAQIDIGDDALVAEMRRNVTVSAGKVGQRFSPGRRVGRRVGVGDVGGNRVAREEPDPDPGISQLRRINLQDMSVVLLWSDVYLYFCHDLPLRHWR